MRIVIFCLIFLSGVFCVSAQTVRIRPAGSGKISVTKGKIRSTIDLSRDIAGCAYIAANYRLSLNQKGCAAPPATFKLVDAAVKNDRTFLIIETNAQENCNVCGRCGASEATTVIWLKLNRQLRILERKSIPLGFCDENITMISPGSASTAETSSDWLNLSFKNNVMSFEFEKRIYGEEPNGDKDAYQFTRVEYNRKTPEKGFVIKAEKRDKSSVN